MTTAAAIAAPEKKKPETPWLTVQEAADRASVSTRLIYENIQRGRLRGARLGARHQIRIHEQWLDDWINSQAPTVVNPDAPGDPGLIAFAPRGRKTGA
jgi:excisionase family DNA binding protein